MIGDDTGSLFNILGECLLIGIYVGAGNVVNRWLFAEGILLPSSLDMWLSALNGH